MHWSEVQEKALQRATFQGTPLEINRILKFGIEDQRAAILAFMAGSIAAAIGTFAVDKGVNPEPPAFHVIWDQMLSFSDQALATKSLEDLENDRLAAAVWLCLKEDIRDCVEPIQSLLERSSIFLRELVVFQSCSVGRNCNVLKMTVRALQHEDLSVAGLSNSAQHIRVEERS
ncbi:hypothetical protein LCM4577_30695 [Mesorhizobium sp. LCM 4577]|nr:hypothetical protein LCM4577_30695 [Mesorhizobium sp. LCM 4577]